jgi:alkylation response protein AidB-like acyl-CoA dehydrogenase
VGFLAVLLSPTNLRNLRVWLAAYISVADYGSDAYAISVYASASRLRAGGSIGAEASTNKIFWSELDVALHRTALSILGARAELVAAGHAPADDDLRWLGGYFFSLAGPIYAGSNEIQKNIIAERMLGLPRG